MSDPTTGTRSESGPGRQSTNVFWLFGQMLIIPLAVLVYGMEMLVKTMKGMQKATNHGMDVIAGGNAGSPQTPSDAPRSERNLTSDPKPLVIHESTTGGTEPTHEERAKMPDTNLSDESLKLVRYKILFVKRDYEVAFPEKEELVADNLTDTAYTAWKIAQFIQGLGSTKVPDKWKSYLPGKKPGDNIDKLPEDDKKYLRVFYEVLQRYPREKLRYEEDHLAALKKIEEAILKDKGGSSGPPGKL